LILGFPHRRTSATPWLEARRAIFHFETYTDLFAKRRGIPVLKHSDGNLYPILDDLVEAGISGLHPMEPGAMDLADVKKKYGEKICLLGNVDCKHVLPSGTEEDVRRDTRRCIDAAAKEGGHILTSSSSIHANSQFENFYTMVNETGKHRS
jgi:uroporphyrinogen decarboxylase